MATIGDRIKAARQARGLTQKELAKLCFTCQPSVAEWETNRRTPRTDTLQRIAGALHVKINELLGEEEGRA